MNAPTVYPVLRAEASVADLHPGDYAMWGDHEFGLFIGDGWFAGAVEEPLRWLAEEVIVRRVSLKVDQ